MRIGKRLKVKDEGITYCSEATCVVFSVLTLDSCFLALNSFAR